MSEEQCWQQRTGTGTLSSCGGDPNAYADNPVIQKKQFLLLMKELLSSFKNKVLVFFKYIIVPYILGWTGRFNSHSCF